MVATVILDTGPLLALVSATDGFRARALQVVNRLRSNRSVVLLTTPPTVTELQFAVSKKVSKDSAPNLLGNLFRTYDIGIETADDEDAVFKGWSDLSARDHKRQRFDYADYYLYRVARSFRAQGIVTVDGGFEALIANEQKTVKFDLDVINLARIPDAE